MLFSCKEHFLFFLALSPSHFYTIVHFTLFLNYKIMWIVQRLDTIYKSFSFINAQFLGSPDE